MEDLLVLLLNLLDNTDIKDEAEQNQLMSDFFADLHTEIIATMEETGRYSEVVEKVKNVITNEGVSAQDKINALQEAISQLNDQDQAMVVTNAIDIVLTETLIELSSKGKITTTQLLDFAADHAEYKQLKKLAAQKRGQAGQSL